MLALGGREVGRPAGMGLGRPMRALEVHQVRQRWLGRSPPELARGHRLQQGYKPLSAAN